MATYYKRLATFGTGVRFGSLRERGSMNRCRSGRRALQSPGGQWTRLRTSRVLRPSRSSLCTTRVSPGLMKSIMFCNSVRPSRDRPDIFSLRMSWQPASLSLVTWMSFVWALISQPDCRPTPPSKTGTRTPDPGTSVSVARRRQFLPAALRQGQIARPGPSEPRAGRTGRQEGGKDEMGRRLRTIASPARSRS